jgi:glucokinase
VAALGECWKGGGKGYDSIVMATLGTGVGGGIVIDGKVVYGAHGAGGEIGHMVLNKEEALSCGCGKYGCVEQYCSATGIVRTAKRCLNRSLQPSSLRDIENLTCKDIFQAGAAGDAVANEILEQVYDHLAEFLSDVCCVVDPELVVLGGGVSKAGEPLIKGISRHMHKYLFHACHGVQFSLATLGNDAGAYGAFKLILDEYRK